MLTEHTFAILPLATSLSALTPPRSAAEARRLAQEQNRRAARDRDEERRDREAFADHLTRLERDIKAHHPASLQRGLDSRSIYAARAAKGR